MGNRRGHHFKEPLPPFWPFCISSSSHRVHYEMCFLPLERSAQQSGGEAGAGRVAKGPSIVECTRETCNICHHMCNLNVHCHYVFLIKKFKTLHDLRHILDLTLYIFLLSYCVRKIPHLHMTLIASGPNPSPSRHLSQKCPARSGPSTTGYPRVSAGASGLAGSTGGEPESRRSSAGLNIRRDIG